jgi:hypothetical protein
MRNTQNQNYDIYTEFIASILRNLQVLRFSVPVLLDIISFCFPAFFHLLSRNRPTERTLIACYLSYSYYRLRLGTHEGKNKGWLWVVIWAVIWFVFCVVIWVFIWVIIWFFIWTVILVALWVFIWIKWVVILIVI